MWKKVVITVLGILLLIFVLNLGLTFWVTYKLPQIINEKNSSPYHITYQSVDVSLVKGNFRVKNISISPKNHPIEAKSKAGIYATISEIEAKGVRVWTILFKHKIKASKINITKPDITLYKKNYQALNDPNSITDDVIKPFKNTIEVSDINLANGSLKIISTQLNQSSLEIDNLFLTLDDVILDDTTLQNKIPFSYKDFSLRCDRIFFWANEFYHLRAKNLKSSPSFLAIREFSMIPVYNRAEFVRKIAVEKDIYAVNAQSVLLKNMDWGFKRDDFYFKADHVILDTVLANIYRSKIPADNLSKKVLYNKLLREIPFKLNVDTLSVRESVLEYEEEKTLENGAGLLSFNRFNMQVIDLSSGYKATVLPDVVIKVDCRFMNNAPLKVDWRFNVLDQSDGFHIKGSLLNFPAESIHTFTKPYMNTTFTGKLNQVYFNFTGNDLTSNGNFAIKYDDLSVAVYKTGKQRNEKHRFFSAVGNILVKNDTGEKLKEVTVSVDRIPEKSFYNFLWRNMEEGLKQTLLKI